MAVRPGRSLKGLWWEKTLCTADGKSQEENHSAGHYSSAARLPPAAEDCTLLANSSWSMGYGNLGETEPPATGRQVTMPPKSNHHEACQTHQVLRWGQRVHVQVAQPTPLIRPCCLCSHLDLGGG